MPTTVTSTIGSGGDYATPALWIAACPANLVTADQIWRGELKNQTHGGTGAGLVLSITGITTDATRYIELTTEAGASFADNVNVQTNALRANASNGAFITTDVTFNYTINCNVAFTRFSKLQIEAQSASGEPIIMSGSAHDCWIDRCIIETNNAFYCLDNGGGDRMKLTNSLLICRTASNTVGLAKFFQDCTIVNNTFVIPSDLAAATYGIDFSFPNNVTIRNNAFFGVTNVWDTAPTGTLVCQTNYTDANSPPSGWTDIAYDTSTGSGFQNTANSTRDFRIKTGSALLDVGTTDSTNAATDIAGTARPQGSAYDAGAWELVSGGGATSYPARRAFPFSILQH
jgi:hypothetical protein